MQMTRNVSRYIYWQFDENYDEK